MSAPEAWVWCIGFLTAGGTVCILATIHASMLHEREQWREERSGLYAQIRELNAGQGNAHEGADRG